MHLHACLLFTQVCRNSENATATFYQNIYFPRSTVPDYGRFIGRRQPKLRATGLGLDMWPSFSAPATVSTPASQWTPPTSYLQHLCLTLLGDGHRGAAWVRRGQRQRSLSASQCCTVSTVVRAQLTMPRAADPCHRLAHLWPGVCEDTMGRGN